MPIRVAVSLPEVVDLLHRLCVADPRAARELLLTTRVPCRPEAMADLGIGVAVGEPQPVVGLLGLLNALFGTAEDTGMPAISIFATLRCSTNPQHQLVPGQRVGAPCAVEGCDGQIALGLPTGAGVTPAGLAALKAYQAEIQEVDAHGHPVDPPDEEPDA